ncbi:cytochrome c oxidase subunit 3 [Mucilaginibacter phenanthrenivorans]|uniref:cytochrome c oxidase subunit 3 n=1 Tax=Mucilaginibacter phenanthrenivorans TaxID=1234842 RepID=UPI0021579235|nr:cytochrome c oxidase subunit 3 [Mucilaginibacter phenanthrenivorans]
MMAQIQQEDKLNLGAKKFSMWIFIFTSVLLFSGFISAFIVYSGGRGHALQVIMPEAFRYSTFVIIFSSVTLHLASKAAKTLQIGKQRMYLWFTIILGVAFFAIQIYAWYVLAFKMQIFFSNPNASRSFIYVFSGVHLAHVIAGLLVLLNAVFATYRNIPQVRNIFKMEMASIFWHFLDIMWICLYVFLLLNQN